MLGVGAGCFLKSDQNYEDAALKILKSCLESDEVPSTSKNVTSGENNFSDPGNSFERQCLSGHSGLAEVHGENQLLEQGGSLVHSGDTDSSDDEYSDYGKILKKMLVEKQEPFKENEVPAHHTSFWQKGSASTASSVSCAEMSQHPSSDVYTDSMFGIRIV